MIYRTPSLKDFAIFTWEMLKWPAVFAVMVAALWVSTR